MARPRKAEPRHHQINLRFSAPELVRVHAHAAILGKTVNEFGRSVLLRRPRRRRGGAPPIVITWSDETLAKWHGLGARLNDIAHFMNARDDFPPGELLALVAQLRTEHTAFEQAARGWTESDRLAKKKLRRQRQATFLQITIALVRLGDIDFALRLPKLAFARRLEELDRIVASRAATVRQPAANAESGPHPAAA